MNAFIKIIITAAALFISSATFGDEGESRGFGDLVITGRPNAQFERDLVAHGKVGSIILSQETRGGEIVPIAYNVTKIRTGAVRNGNTITFTLHSAEATSDFSIDPTQAPGCEDVTNEFCMTAKLVR